MMYMSPTDHGTSQAGGAAVVICDEGYQLRQSSNNKLVCRSVIVGEKRFELNTMCREDGSWRSSIGAEFPVCAEKGCLYDDLVIQPPENGNVEVNKKHFTLRSEFLLTDFCSGYREEDHLP